MTTESTIYWVEWNEQSKDWGPQPNIKCKQQAFDTEQEARSFARTLRYFARTLRSDGWKEVSCACIYHNGRCIAAAFDSDNPL